MILVKTYLKQHVQFWFKIISSIFFYCGQRLIWCLKLYFKSQKINYSSMPCLNVKLVLYIPVLSVNALVSVHETKNNLSSVQC